SRDKRYREDQNPNTRHNLAPQSCPNHTTEGRIYNYLRRSLLECDLSHTPRRIRDELAANGLTTAVGCVFKTVTAPYPMRTRAAWLGPGAHERCVRPFSRASLRGRLLLAAEPISANSWSPRFQELSEIHP